MANRAYLRVWTRDFSEQTMMAEFARFLTTAPLAEAVNAFEDLTIQPVDTTETPVAAWDLRAEKFGPAEVTALAMQHLNSDSAYIVRAKWELWDFNVENLTWARVTQPLVLTCYGVDFDSERAQEEGHFAADLGFEYFFTGHAGLLAPGKASNPFDSSDHPAEHTFRRWMSTPTNLKEYHAKTRENIQQLFSWVEGVQNALPVQRSELASEGEENFEARLDAIVAQR